MRCHEEDDEAEKEEEEEDEVKEGLERLVAEFSRPVRKRPAARVLDDMPGAPRKRQATAAAECPEPSASAPRPRYTLMFYKATGAYAVRDKESGNQLCQVQVPGVPDGK